MSSGLILRLTGLPPSGKISPMSAAEIIKELSKLTEAERRAVLNKLRELSEQDEDIRAANATADEPAAALDRMEEQAAI